MKIKNYKKVVSVFCDYCATGIWIDGSSASFECLEEIGFDHLKTQHVFPDLERYQELYEGFDFYSNKADYAKIYASDDFKEYKELGLKIFTELDKVSPYNVLVEHLDEKTGERFIIIDSKIVNKKDV